MLTKKHWKKALVGYSGFVGSNLAKSVHFDGLYNSKNIQDAFDTPYDLVIYSGVRAEKFLANQNPDQDLEHIKQAAENIRRIKAKSFVLISTIDVFHTTENVDELSTIDKQQLKPYGLHRCYLEQWTREVYPDALVLRLPALYGANLKKNFIFDLIHLIPSMIAANKFEEVCSAADFPLRNYYEQQANGFFKVRGLSNDEKRTLRAFFQSQAFNALSFTDHRSAFQFYPLNHLWDHIETALQNRLTLACLNSEPVTAGEVFQEIFNRPFSQQLPSGPVRYAVKSVHAGLFGGKNGFMFDRPFILSDIHRFVEGELAICA